MKIEEEFTAAELLLLDTQVGLPSIVRSQLTRLGFRNISWALLDLLLLDGEDALEGLELLQWPTDGWRAEGLRG